MALGTLAEGLRLSQQRARQTLPSPPPSSSPATVAPAAPDEVGLARRFAAGEAGAFDDVVALYQLRVTRLANRLLGWGDGRDAHDVDDAVQDVFLAALTNARRCRGGASGLWPWLATITVNTCRSIRRRAWVRLRFVRDLLARPALEEPRRTMVSRRTNACRRCATRCRGCRERTAK